MPRALPVLLAALVGVAACRAPRPPAPESTGPGVDAATWLRPRDRRATPGPDVLAQAARARIVLLGEHHDRMAHHRWQAQVIAGLLARRRHVVVGFEMFPRRAQPVLDRWIAGGLDAPRFLADVDWDRVWGFPARLYLPLFELARANRLPMVALNVERALVGRVAREGWEAIPDAEREGLGTPAPAAPAYAATLAETFGAHGHAADPDPAAARRFVEAQLTWDRALAEALAAAAAAYPDAVVVGVMGSGHLERGFGVPHQLAALGERDVVVLIPWDVERDCGRLAPDVADWVFGIAPSAEPAPPRLGIELAPGDGGVRVVRVEAGSVAAAAGLRPGDVIVAAAGAVTPQPSALRTIVEGLAPGTWLPLDVRRGGRTQTLVARFGPAS
ncbi:MAG: ChaN family lipoprotein [bacterium]|nr:ChaN family lipoprotein [bacterium]